MKTARTRIPPTTIAWALPTWIALGLISWSSAHAAPPQSTRQELIDRASPAVGYSYYWGHGCWRTDGQSLGSCSGSCPNCTHSGSYGADCSGFVAKVWQVPSASDVTEDLHPYSTHTFRYSETYWTQVDRSSAQMGDAMVYRNSSDSAGHIVLFEKGDPWGDMWTFEARGCSYGIVHNLRSLGSTYVAIERDNLTGGGCTPDCSGRQCGPDPVCSQSCGTCGTDETCNASGQCESSSCTPNCWGLECGPDPVCNTSCGTCDNGKYCDYLGRCVTDNCTPDCSGLECGPDPVCGTSCGTCPQGMYCTGGSCILEDCTPDCSGRECGPDPNCNTSCGLCDKEEYCDSTGHCVNGACTPNCGGRECGLEPTCGTSCGTCPYGQFCNSSGHCLTNDCTPDCTNRKCGLDPECGMLCGTCPADALCNASGQCVGGSEADAGQSPPSNGLNSIRGHCNMSGAGGSRPLFPVILLLALSYLVRRRKRTIR